MGRGNGGNGDQPLGKSDRLFLEIYEFKQLKPQIGAYKRRVIQTRCPLYAVDYGGKA